MREIKGTIFFKAREKQIFARLARCHLYTKKNKIDVAKKKRIIFFLIHFFRAHDHGIIGVRAEYRPMNSKLKIE